MSSVITAAPGGTGYHSFRQFSVDEYHKMIEVGILDETDRVELLEGHVVLKMPRNPPHDGTIQRVQKRLFRLLPAGWDLRIQSAITLGDSEPEPDLTVARGDDTTYLQRHPGAADIGLLVEVADSSLDRDRNDKARVYARAGIPIYWIVNIVDQQVEVHTAPSSSSSTPAYAQRQVLAPGATVPLVLDGVTAGSVPVAELLP